MARVLVSAVLAETIFPKDSVLIRYIRVIRGLSALTRFPNFPRNLAPDFTHYMSERPEMTSSKQGVKEGQNNRRKLNHE